MGGDVDEGLGIAGVFQCPFDPVAKAGFLIEVRPAPVGEKRNVIARDSVRTNSI